MTTSGSIKLEGIAAGAYAGGVVLCRRRRREGFVGFEYRKVRYSSLQMISQFCGMFVVHLI